MERRTGVWFETWGAIAPDVHTLRLFLLAKSSLMSGFLSIETPHTAPLPFQHVEQALGGEPSSESPAPLSSLLALRTGSGALGAHAGSRQLGGHHDDVEVYRVLPVVTMEPGAQLCPGAQQPRLLREWNQEAAVCPCHLPSNYTLRQTPTLEPVL